LTPERLAMKYPGQAIGFAALLFAGCGGAIGDEMEPEPEPEPVIPPPAKVTLAPPMVRRLTALQYQNSLRDLLGTRITQGAAEPGGDAWTGFALVTAALLGSPNFLDRTELGDASLSDGTRRPLTDFEIATRLSYLVWNTTPDGTLLDAATRGELHTPAGLKTQ